MSATMRPLGFVHIGLQKTATTTLQEHFFAHHPAVAYLGRPYANSEVDALVKAIYLHETLDFDTARWARVRDAKIRPFIGKGRILGISDEFFSAPGCHADRGVVAERLKWLMGGSLVVITIRNQVDVLRSEYVDTIKYRPYVPFPKWVADGLADPAGSSLRLYDYAKLAHCYSAVFGRENVGIFLFEEFLREREAFLERLCAFLGIDPAPASALLTGKHENPRKSSRLLRYKAIRSRLLPGIQFSRLLPGAVSRPLLRYLHAGAPASLGVAEPLRRRIEDHYRESNRALAAEYSLPLAPYGYAT